MTNCRERVYWQCVLRMMQCGAVCCSVWHCVLQCVLRMMRMILVDSCVAVCCSVLQSVLVCCSVLQCVLQCVACVLRMMHMIIVDYWWCFVMQIWAGGRWWWWWRRWGCDDLMVWTATHCKTLQHTATHCNTLQHAAAHCNTLHHACLSRSRRQGRDDLMLCKTRWMRQKELLPVSCR